MSYVTNIFEGVETMMVSQPLRGKTEDEITADRNRAINFSILYGFNFINTRNTDDWYDPEAMKGRGVANVPLCFFAKSIESMSKCQLAYFAYGWEFARGCRLEHAVAESYGLVIVEEKGPNGSPLHVSRQGPDDARRGRQWFEISEEYLRSLDAKKA